MKRTRKSRLFYVRITFHTISMNIYYRVKREVIKYKKGMTQKSRFLKKQDFVESAPGKSSLFSPRGIQFT